MVFCENVIRSKKRMFLVEFVAFMCCSRSRNFVENPKGPRNTAKLLAPSSVIFALLLLNDCEEIKYSKVFHSKLNDAFRVSRLC